MACCGQNRETLRASYTSSSPPPTRHAARPVVGAASGSASIRYLNGGHVLVRGPRTGWQYEFSPANPVQAVDPRDAESFVATGLFELTGKA